MTRIFGYVSLLTTDYTDYTDFGCVSFFYHELHEFHEFWLRIVVYLFEFHE